MILPEFCPIPAYHELDIQWQPVYIYERLIQVVPFAQSNAVRPSWLRILAVAVGYGVALYGTLSVFRSPLYISGFAFMAGLGIVLFACREMPPMTWRGLLILVAGFLLIIAVLAFFGEYRVRQWRPHPAGYIPAWFVFFYAVRQVHFLISNPDEEEEDPFVKRVHR